MRRGAACPARQSPSPVVMAGVAQLTGAGRRDQSGTQAADGRRGRQAPALPDGSEQGLQGIGQVNPQGSDLDIR